MFWLSLSFMQEYHLSSLVFSFKSNFSFPCRCFSELNFISDRLVPPCGNQLPLEIVPPPAAPSLPHEELQKQLQQLKQVISQLEDRLRLQGVPIVLNFLFVSSLQTGIFHCQHLFKRSFSKFLTHFPFRRMFLLFCLQMEWLLLWRVSVSSAMAITMFRAHPSTSRNR